MSGSAGFVLLRRELKSGWGGKWEINKESHPYKTRHVSTRVTTAAFDKKQHAPNQKSPRHPGKIIWLKQ